MKVFQIQPMTLLRLMSICWPERTASKMGLILRSSLDLQKTLIYFTAVSILAKVDIKC